MLVAPLAKNEAERLAVLRSYELLDSQGDAAFDALTHLAGTICQTPIALISLVDEERQWFLARSGLEAEQTHRDLAFCAHAIHGTELFLVPDTHADHRFADNPLVTEEPKIQFYAGQPLVDQTGAALGTLCVIDRIPRQLSPSQQDALKSLATAVLRLMELRRDTKRHLAALAAQQRQHEMEGLTLLAAGLGHQLNNPLMVVQGNLSLAMEAEDPADLSDSLVQAQAGATQIANTIRRIQGLDRGIEEGQCRVSDAVEHALGRVRLQAPADAQLQSHVGDLPAVPLSKQDLSELILALLLNGLEAQPTGQQPQLEVSACLEGDELHLRVQDNGHGVPESIQTQIFRPLFTTHAEHKLGLGLSTAAKRLHSIGGQLSLEHTSPKGSVFLISLPTKR